MPDTEPTISDELRDQVAPVLGRTASGVFVVTASDGNGRQTGMLASWVQQAAFEPPMITVAVNRKRYLNEWLQKHPRLVVNIVGKSQSKFLKHFGRGFEPDEPAFEGLPTTAAPSGLPVLDDAIGWLEGDVVGQTDAGDHIVYVVNVTAAGSGPGLDNDPPMVHIRKNGFGY